jgi:hypothetical protein
VTDYPTHKPAYVPTSKPVPTSIEVTTDDVSKMLCYHVEFISQNIPSTNICSSFKSPQRISPPIRRQTRPP